MRLLAATTLVLAVLATMPVAPALNECRSPCQTVPLQPTPLNAKGTTYYVYAQALTCQPTDAYCSGGAAPRARGIVYEEANCESGLQRFRTIDCAADRVVLL